MTLEEQMRKYLHNLYEELAFTIHEWPNSHNENQVIRTYRTYQDTISGQLRSEFDQDIQISNIQISRLYAEPYTTSLGDTIRVNFSTQKVLVNEVVVYEW